MEVFDFLFPSKFLNFKQPIPRKRSFRVITDIEMKWKFQGSIKVSGAIAAIILTNSDVLQSFKNDYSWFLIQKL